MAYDTDARRDAAADLKPISLGGSGQAVTLKSKGNSTRDAATLTRTVSSASQDTSGLEIAYTAFQIDGTLIQAGDKSFMLSALQIDQTTPLSPEPRAGDWLTISGRDWLIMSVEPLAMAGLSMLFTLHLRGAAA